MISMNTNYYPNTSFGAYVRTKGPKPRHVLDVRDIDKTKNISKIQNYDAFTRQEKKLKELHQQIARRFSFEQKGGTELP